MNICFFGVGGVGGYFGSLVTNKFIDQHNIYFIARGAHKDTINTRGLTLKKSGGDEIINVTPTLCTDNTSDLPICDIIFLSVKSYDLKKASEEISKISNEKTIILPLLNGVDIYDRIREHLNHGIVLPSCVYVGTHIESPGVIYQKGGSCKISIGKDPKSPEFYPEALLTLLKNSFISFNWEENVQIAIWSKYMFIAAFGLVTATHDKSLGEIIKNEKLSELVLSIMNEIYEIAKKQNIPLESDIVEKSYVKAQEFPYNTKTSFQRDIESKGKINEGDLFGGTLIRFGERLIIPVENIKETYKKLLDNLSD